MSICHIFLRSFYLIDEYFEWRTWIPGFAEFLVVVGEIVGVDLAICGKEEVKDITGDKMIEMRVRMTKSADIDGINGSLKLFFQSAVHIVTKSPAILTKFMGFSTFFLLFRGIVGGIRGNEAWVDWLYP